MMKYIVSAAMLLMLAGTTMGIMWLYDDPKFFPIQPWSESPAFDLRGAAALEIAESPYFSTLGEDFYMRPIPVRFNNSTNAVKIGSIGTGTQSFLTSPSFGGHVENNLKFAQSRSSLRVGGPGSWTNLSI